MDSDYPKPAKLMTETSTQPTKDTVVTYTSKKIVPITLRIVKNHHREDEEVVAEETIDEERVFEAIPYLVQHRSISTGYDKEAKPETITVDQRTVNPQTLRLIVSIARYFGSAMPPAGKVSSNVMARDAMGPQMWKFIKDLNNNELERLYKAAHYLSMYSLRMHVACVFAEMVYVEGNYPQFEEKKRQLGVKVEYNFPYAKKMMSEEEYLTL